MLKSGLSIAWTIIKVILTLLTPLYIFLIVFALLCVSWFLVFKFYFKLELKPSGIVPVKGRPLLKQLFYDLPRRYIMDIYEREPDFFDPHGIHMFCGEQGCGKTIACVEMMLRYQKMYPKSKMITNFGVV